jgi:hypothetical protein
MGAPLHEPPATKSGRAGCASDRRRQPGQQLHQPAGEASNKSTKVEREGWLEAGSQSAPGAVSRRGPEAAAQQARRGGQLGGSERRGRSNRQKERDNGGDRGAAGTLYSGQAARGRDPRSGGAKPKETTHRHRFYKGNRPYGLFDSVFQTDALIFFMISPQLILSHGGLQVGGISGQLTMRLLSSRTKKDLDVNKAQVN